MSHWTEEWTIESVENNHRILGIIEPEDVKQIIAEAKELQYLYKWLGDRHMGELLQMAGEAEDEENA